MYQETKEMPLTGLAEPKFKRLVDAIYRGIEKHPIQAFDTYIRNLPDGEQAACVIAAAMEGGINHFDKLFSERVRTPYCLSWLGEHCFVSVALMQLNDNARWTREAIADWLLRL